ncbi:N-acetylmuramoyl-L-alanine amidase [Streptomyces sp. NPDC059578]|uniref:N-acetylmuramoyl-L-alanine amidase n=1 Tax=Streptomyces sp. NPDC059578 TaxID=3346874 RepID=UPI00367B6524
MSHPEDRSAPRPESRPEPGSVPAQAGRRTRRRALLAAAVLLPVALVAGLALAQEGSPEGRPASVDGKNGGEGAAGSSPSGGAPVNGSGGSGGPAAKAPLAGKVVVVDPGHNPGNFQHAQEIDREVDIGTGRKACDATGTTTSDGPGGYREADFTLDVSRKLRARLRELGATVILTHDADRAWGPCVDERARIGNEARADAVVSVHADGSARGNRGHHLILPARVKAGAADTAAIVGPSRDLGERIGRQFALATGSEPANYLGGGSGIDVRDDLGGLNLSRVPKVFIECGNMRDPQDAARLTDGAWREKAARGIAEGIMSFLRG